MPAAKSSDLGRDKDFIYERDVIVLHSSFDMRSVSGNRCYVDGRQVILLIFNVSSVTCQAPRALIISMILHKR